ncbi:hypothetical protein HX021_08325 [Sphingobacterium sp. N143]|uniref:hypothetical protein n=1 Tax=Sphingobacterium sp. N143 TaxID=2746727 RepID=UPI0025759AE3|nr:hypothetical protein [Sphingobacterium sp. N143]MDM1294303.1 hypothetical protein [Sphingobacterium sp. N143]
MKTLKVQYKGKIIHAKFTIEEKGMGLRDYYIHHKNGYSFYIFRKSEGVWRIAYGDLDEDLKESIIAALSERFG